jgi:hypothetical protein
MTGFCGMHKKGRTAGGSQGGGNFSTNMTALAYASDHHPTLTFKQAVNALSEAMV